MEVAFVLVPLLGLTFLLLNLSMAICLRATFQHAVREGVRYAITGQNSPGPCQDDSVKAYVQANAAGFLSSTYAKNTLHVHFINPTTGAVSNNQGGNIVEASVEAYQYSPWAPYRWLASPVLMWARAYDVMRNPPLLSMHHQERVATMAHNAKKRRSGVAVVEFSFSLLVLVPLVLGVFVFGFRLIFSLQMMQVTRDLGHMYIEGINFRLSGPIGNAADPGQRLQPDRQRNQRGDSVAGHA